MKTKSTVKSTTKVSALKVSNFKNSSRKSAKSINLKTTQAKNKVLASTEAKRKKTGKATTKKRDSAASKERLLDAGTLVFSTHGFNGSTTKMIAHEANVNEALIARYFGGKEGLFISILHRFVDKKINEELSYPPQDNVESELIKYAETRFIESEEDECLGKIIIGQALTDDKFRKRALQEIPMDVSPHLKARLQLLLNNNKIAKKHKVFDLCDDIETYLHGTLIFDIILLELPRDQVLKKVRSFVTRFTRGILS